MKTKKDKQYSFDHVCKRLNDRFCLSITLQEFDYLSSQFKIDKSNMILVENQDQEIHQIRFKGSRVTFAYSISRGYITTALKWGRHDHY
jgi:hypothetical protein